MRLRNTVESSALHRAAMGVLLAVVLAAPAGAALCTKPNGKVVARSGDCKRKETPLAAIALPPGATGDPGAPGTSQPRLRAVDANGQQLPGVLDTTGELVHRIGDAVFGIEITVDGFAPGFLLFNADGCTGAPRVNAATGALYAKARVQGSTAYYATGVPALQAIESISTPTSASDCMGVGKTFDAATGLCCTDVMFSTEAASVTTFDVGGFVPPFHVEVEE